jgi:uncharacterized cupin superfamily protein
MKTTFGQIKRGQEFWWYGRWYRKTDKNEAVDIVSGVVILFSEDVVVQVVEKGIGDEKG